MNYSNSKFKLTNSTLHFGPLTNFTTCHVQLNFQIHCHTQTFPFLVAIFYREFTIWRIHKTKQRNGQRELEPTLNNKHASSRMFTSFPKLFWKFLHPLLPSRPLEKFTNTKRTFYKISCFETLPSFEHHMSKYQLLYFPFPISNLSLKILANDVLLRTKMATLDYQENWLSALNLR